MNERVATAVASLVFAILFVGIMSFVFPAGHESFMADLLFDRNTNTFPYPLTIQNVMWVTFFFGCGELIFRYRQGRAERRQLDKRLLPEDPETMLRRGQDLAPFYRGIVETDPEGRFWLQRMLKRAILRFQGSGSVDQTSGLLNATLELFQHEVDLRYNLLRYLVWLIPTLGFIGTVVGIALALESAGLMFSAMSPATDLAELGPELMKTLTAELGVAFYTTLLALVQSAFLMFFMHVVQGDEERALNLVGQYCLDNLVNRLYEKT